MVTGRWGAPELPTSGTRFEAFEVGARVGRGATSEVWQALDRRTGRRVALKIGRCEEARAILSAEGERMALGLSPFVPELVDLGIVPSSAEKEEWVGAPYLALAWIDGAPLDVRALHAERSSADRCAIALAVVRDVAAALADLHAAGVAHGDVKPANIVVLETGEKSSYGARLVDLGLSTYGDDRIIAGGTPRYLPPESWTLGNVGDARARDRFALGIVVAEILDEGVSRSNHPAERARELRLEPPFDVLCGTLLAVDPGARPRAAWIAATAREASGLAETKEQRSERRERAVRASYLAGRRADITRAGRTREAVSSVVGLAGEWLSEAVELGRRCALLRNELAEGGEWELREADDLARSRWLVGLVGSPAASWPLHRVAAASDASWAAGLSSLARLRDPASWSLGDVESAILAETGEKEPRNRTAVTAQPLATEAPLEEAVRLSIALASAAPDRTAIQAVERGERNSPRLLLTAADALRRLGETGRALALLTGLAGSAAHALRAEIARRMGERARAELEARAALSLAPEDDAALAVLARLCLESGDATGALHLLELAPPSAKTAEVKALSRIALGDRPGAEREILVAEALASTDEARARLAGLTGFVAFESGDVGRALAAYGRAAEHAARAGALIEEATYRTGEAAAAVDQGDIGRALAAAKRASLLWDDLGRPADAARALLARAAAFAAAGARTEAIAASHDAGERARELGDRRAQAFACWAITDVMEPGHPDGIEAARRAWSLLSDERGNTEGRNDGAGKKGADMADSDRLRAQARLLGHAPAEIAPDALSWGDEAAARDGMVVAARFDWWAARARTWLDGQSSGRAETPVAEVLRIAGAVAPIASRGPALASAAALAARIGDGTSLRVLSRAHAEAAREFLALVPGDLRESARSLAWLRSSRSPEEPGVSPEQIADIEALVRALGTRDRLRPLLEQVLDSLVSWTGVERGLLLLHAPNGRLVPRAARNLARADLLGEQRALSESIARRAIEVGEPVVAVDASGEMSSVYASVHALKLRSVLAVPLLARGETLGVVYLDDRVRRGAFGPKELAWVKLVASLAAVAISDAKDQILLRRAARRAERAKLALGHELARREAELALAEKELARTREARDTRFSYDAIIGKSRAIDAMLRLVDRVTLSSVPVLLVGESGSGKELVARAIHANGSRGQETFVGENCSAIPEPLLESTLFGHARGAFTGADRPRAGLFETAHRGTLFLDEIGEMSLAMQTKLLRVLEEGQVRPLGSERERKVDVRIIAATHRDLEQMVKDGQFREDLFYRLNVITIRVPPLRERPDDIPLLVRHFLAVHAADRRVRISPEAMALLAASTWPGNVRQLQNEVRRAVVLSDEVIGPEHLSGEVRQGAAERQGKTLGLRVRARVDALEIDLVKDALGQTHGNQTRAAELLGLSRFGLQKMMKRLAIKSGS